MASDDSGQVNDPPQLMSPLIGRGGEVEEILSLLATARLLTLTGTGGSGKTRLAAQVAAESRATFPDGVRWVNLGALTDPALVPNVVATQCGVHDRVGSDVVDSLVATLRQRHTLLVLDNCEHVLSDCAHLVETLLTACPELRILATSREALTLPGEVVWLVAPLRAPTHDSVKAADDLMAYEAIALFVARASEALPQFCLTPANAASVVRICRRVEGLPLALELAAARLRVLSPVELAERLDDSLHLLTRGNRTAPPRQQTLRATLDWSYQLLTSEERAAFRRLAVFAGSFSLEGAERICSGADVAEVEVLELVSRLVEKSMVTVHDRGEQTRYRLLEPLLQFAREQLVESGEVDLTQERHRDWCAAIAAQASAGLTGPEQGYWLDRLETEHDNLRVALGWCLAHRDVAGAGQIAADIWQFWLLRGHLREGRRRLDQILAALAEPTPLRANLHWIAAIFAQPDLELGRHRLEESLTLWQALGDRDGAARVLGTLGFASQTHGEHERAVSYLEQCLPLARASGDAPLLARVLTGLALSVLNLGDTERAMHLCQEGLDVSRQAGDLRGAAAATANLGLIWQALRDEQRAGELWEQSLAERRRIGDRGGEAHVLSLLGSLALAQRAYSRATALYQESLALRQQMGDGDGVAPVLEGLAAVAAAQGDAIPATLLAAAADTLRSATGVPLPPLERAAHDRTIASLRVRLGPESFARAWSEGQALSTEQAMDIAERLQAPGGYVEQTPSPGYPSPAPAAALSAGAYALTRRETDVLRLLTYGLTYAQIGETLVISPRTVDAHVRGIFNKLDVHSRSAATRIALQHQLV